MKEEIKKDGFTLIETIIAIILLGIIMTAGMTLFFSSQEGMGWAVHKRLAVELASSELELLRNNGYVNLPALGLYGPDPINIGGITGLRTIAITSVPSVDYRRIQVQITWKAAGKNQQNPQDQQVTLDTFIAP